MHIGDSLRITHMDDMGQFDKIKAKLLVPECTRLGNVKALAGALVLNAGKVKLKPVTTEAVDSFNAIGPKVQLATAVITSVMGLAMQAPEGDVERGQKRKAYCSRALASVKKQKLKLEPELLRQLEQAS